MKTIQELYDMRHRAALITGGAGHIGTAIAVALAEAGASIAILDTDANAASAAAARVKDQYGVESMAVAMDLTDDAAVRSVPEQVTRRFGRLDVLVHCAALVGTSALSGWAVPFAEQNVTTWRKAIDVNLTSVFVLTQACADLLRVSGHGSVITINSIYGMLGPSMALYEGTALGNPAAYAASKGGLMQLTRWFATVLAPTIRANTITLGGIFRGHTEPFLSRYTSRTPLARMGREEDVKGAALFLSSDLSQYVTGQNLVVDGGWSAW